MEPQPISVTTPDGSVVVGTRWPGGQQHVVLLHAGVADRRAWEDVARTLADDGIDVVTYDRRGHGDTDASTEPFSHLDDLVTVLDALGIERALLVGNSMGGALALDAALTLPERVTGAVVIGAAVTGMTDEDTPFDWTLDPATAPLLECVEAPVTPDDERIRALAHLWLDGPAAPEGRVSGPARELFEDMNRRILAVGAPDDAGATDLDTWARLGEVSAPVLCAWGSLDVPADLPFYEETARRLGQGPGRVLPDVAHLPGLEAPDVVVELVREALGR